MKRTPYFCAKRFLRQLLAVEIRHLARADDVELQDLEALLDESLDLGLGEIDQVGFLAIGTAAQLPHDGERLFFSLAAVEIVGQLEEALEEPGLGIEAVVGQLQLVEPKQARGNGTASAAPPAIRRLRDNMDFKVDLDESMTFMMLQLYGRRVRRKGTAKDIRRALR